MDAQARGAEAVDRTSPRLTVHEGESVISVLDATHEAFVSISIEGTVTGWNRAAEETFGWARGEAVGRPLAELIIPAPYREAHHRGLRRFLETGEGRLVNRRVELSALHRDGHEFPVELTISPMRVSDGIVFVAFLHDITDRRWADRELRRLAAIVETSSDAIVSGDLDGTIESWNAGAERLYGYSAEEMIGQSITRLWPSGEGEMAAQRERLLAGEPVRDFQTRELRRDGSQVDVSVSMSPLRDEQGRVTGVSWIARDVSEWRASERALLEARERFQGAFEGAPIGMMLVHPDGRFLSVNPAMCKLLGREEADLRGIHFQTVTHPDDVDAQLEGVRRTLAGEQHGFELEKRYLRSDGSVVWGLLAVSLVRDQAGEPLYFVSQVMDITDRKDAEGELRRYADHLSQMALQDPLTGLRNYRDFHAALDSELERVRRHGGEFSLVLLDVDDFSRLNSQRGHLEGDHLLREVSRLITGACRASDVAARIGGDEFALILPETGEPGAEEVAERIATGVRDLGCDVSLSYGAASWPAAGDSKELLLVRADMALYATRAPASKSGGETDWPGSVRERIERVVALARDQLGMDVAFLGEFRGGSEVFHAVVGDGASFGIEPGAELPLSETYCERMVEGRIPSIVGDSANEPELCRLPVTEDAAVGAYVGVPLQLRDGRLYGALCGLSHGAREDLSERHAELLRFLAGLVGELLEQASEEQRDRRSQVELTGVHALVAALEARDHYTGQHSRTVVRLATAVGERLGLSRDEVSEVEQVAILHDVGKVGIPDVVLQKRGPLTPEEWALMRHHPVVGERVVASTESLAHLGPAVRAEHERFDGTGYPDGLRAEEIPVASRITLACDAYHAMTSDRPYRSALSSAQARRELEANAGTQFDPEVVKVLLEVLDEGPEASAPKRSDSSHGRRSNGRQRPLGIPAWHPRTPRGTGVALGDVRCRCARCGTHATALVTRTAVSGSCANCGGDELELLQP